MVDTIKIGSFPVGLDNRAADFALEKGALRDAVNVDIMPSGHPRRRAGRTSVYAGSSIHSFWSDGLRAFFVEDGELREMYSDSSVRVLMTGLAPHKNVVYAVIPGRGIAFTNGQVIARIVGDEVRPFGLAVPNSQPAISVDAAGSLFAGLYQVACTFIDEFGEESGAVVEQQVAVPANGAITVGLPARVEPQVRSIAVYLTPLNGDLAYLAAVVPYITTSIVIPTMPILGRKISHLFLRQLPPGNVICQHQGRTYVADGTTVYYTEPYSPFYHPVRDYMLFPKPVSIMAPMPDGMYIVADKTYFMVGGDPAKAALQNVDPIGAVAGTLEIIQDTLDVTWFTSSGLVRASPGGSLKFLQEDHVSVSPAKHGAALYRDQNGLCQVLSALRDPGGSVGGASSWFSAQLITEGTRHEI